MNTKAKGDLTEAVVLAELLKAGKCVLLPFGDNQRYDLVIDDNGKFIRVQCKTGRVVNGVLRFSTASVHWHRGKPQRGYKDQADVFGVYCPQLGTTYLIPVADMPKTDGYLRLSPAKNNQQQGIKLASGYLLKTAAIV